MESLSCFHRSHQDGDEAENQAIDIVHVDVVATPRRQRRAELRVVVTRHPSRDGQKSLQYSIVYPNHSSSSILNIFLAAVAVIVKSLGKRLDGGHQESFQEQRQVTRHLR